MARASPSPAVSVANAVSMRTQARAYRPGISRRHERATYSLCTSGRAGQTAHMGDTMFPGTFARAPAHRHA
ncbi:hypothetical protein NL676_012901 [Syzygium grande]|nr:hypothetical protein NL676_012901 [Syzygium grande]